MLFFKGRLLRFIRPFSFFLFYAFSSNGLEHHAQLTLADKQARQLYGTIAIHNFLDNTEYFHKIMEGETIFGYHFLPSLNVCLTEQVSFNLGILWKRYFGHPKPWSGFCPILSTYIASQHLLFRMGLFDQRICPTTFLSPLLNPNRSLYRPLVEGLYFHMLYPKSYLICWLDWMTLLSKAAEKPEIFTFHLDGAYRLLHHENKEIKFPVQGSIYHSGGQGISIKDYTLFCAAFGMDCKWATPYFFWQEMRMAGYLCFSTYAKTLDRPFKRGCAQLYTMEWIGASMGLALEYWYAKDFSSENMGNPLYQSIRIIAQKVVHYEPIRSLLFVTLYKRWVPCSNIEMDIQVKPYYDFKNHLLEYGIAGKLSCFYNICPIGLNGSRPKLY